MLISYLEKETVTSADTDHLSVWQSDRWRISARSVWRDCRRKPNQFFNNLLINGVWCPAVLFRCSPLEQEHNGNHSSSKLATYTVHYFSYRLITDSYGEAWGNYFTKAITEWKRFITTALLENGKYHMPPVFRVWWQKSQRYGDAWGNENETKCTATDHWQLSKNMMLFLS